MKRHYDLSVDSDPPALNLYDTQIPTSNDVKAARQITKRRRVVGPDAWNGISRSNSALQDINNLSHHSTNLNSNYMTPLPSDNQKPTNPSAELVFSRAAVPGPIPGPGPSLSVSTSQHPIPLARTSAGRSLPGSAPVGSEPSRSNFPQAQFIPQVNPVRIKQLQGFRYDVRTSRVNSPDSDDDGQSDDTANEDEDEELEGEDPAKETIEDSVERKTVETRYSDINKILGNLFLSRHRGRA